MAMFTFHIAYILQIMSVAAGLVALHFSTQLSSKLIKSAGILLVVFGIAGVICTGYFGVKYYTHGHYEHAYDASKGAEGCGPNFHCYYERD
jgi:hypothetical protein